jgi:hypothetical protein
MPVFIAKYHEKRNDFESLNASPDLLGTIKVPRNLSLLTDRLPKANYETESKANPLNEVKEDDNESNYKRVVGNMNRISSNSNLNMPGQTPVYQPNMVGYSKKNSAGKPPLNMPKYAQEPPPSR